jgi:hypothetical protein
MRIGVVMICLLGLASHAVGDSTSLAEKERLVKQTIAEFYKHLMADSPPKECPPLFDGVATALSEMPPALRESLGEPDETAAVWKYLRLHREALALLERGATYESAGLNIRYARFGLGPSKDEGHIILQVIGGTDTNKTGIRKEVGFVLAWSDTDHRYRISPAGLTVNGVIVLDPRGQFERPADLWQALGFHPGNSKR